jgi:hypothetical protein
VDGHLFGGVDRDGSRMSLMRDLSLFDRIGLGRPILRCRLRCGGNGLLPPISLELVLRVLISLKQEGLLQTLSAAGDNSSHNPQIPIRRRVSDRPEGWLQDVYGLLSDYNLP